MPSQRRMEVVRVKFSRKAVRDAAAKGRKVSNFEGQLECDGDFKGSRKYISHRID